MGEPLAPAATIGPALEAVWDSTHTPEMKSGVISLELTLSGT